MHALTSNLERAIIAPANNRGATKWNVLGLETTCIVAGEETGGEYSIVETLARPNQGPPLHVHESEDEIFCVVEGEFEIRCGAETFAVTGGDVAVLPRRVPHTFRNVGSKTGRILTTITPGGFEQFFAEVSRDIVSMPPDLPKLLDIAGRYKLRFVL